MKSPSARSTTGSSSRPAVPSNEALQQTKPAFTSIGAVLAAVRQRRTDP